MRRSSVLEKQFELIVRVLGGGIGSVETWECQFRFFVIENLEDLFKVLPDIEMLANTSFFFFC